MKRNSKRRANTIKLLVLTGVILVPFLVVTSSVLATGYNYGNSGDPIPSAADPHGKYLTTESNCKTCHASHGAPTDSFRLLRNNSRDSECDYCHLEGTVSDKIINRDGGAHGTHLSLAPGRGPMVYCYSCHSTHPSQPTAVPNFPEFRDRKTFLDSDPENEPDTARGL